MTPERGVVRVAAVGRGDRQGLEAIGHQQSG